MNIAVAKKKLADGRLTLAKAGNDPDLLGVALTKIHAALEDACRGWLSNLEVAQHHQKNVYNCRQISAKELLKLMSKYYQWTSEDVEYVCQFSDLRDRVIRGDEFKGSEQDLENYAIYVENWLNQERKAVIDPLFPAESPFFSSPLPPPVVTPRKVAAPIKQPSEPANLILAYALWGLCLFGFCGIHRFYLGRPVTGTVWLFSYGFLFLGQLLDLFLIPSLVKDNSNDYWQRLRQVEWLPVVAIDIAQQIFDRCDRLDRAVPQSLLGEKRDATAMKALLDAAAANGKVLSFGQAVMATGLQPNEVEALFNEAMRRGVAHIGNDPQSGAVRYYFDI
jgi:TM2 domain-containing membrane protein YozV